MKPKQKAFYAYNSIGSIRIHRHTKIHNEPKIKFISRYINKKTITIFKTSVVSPRLSESTVEELSASFPSLILSWKYSEGLKGKRENQISKEKWKTVEQ